MTQTSDPWSLISPDEFRDRQNQARRSAEAAGLDGVLVYSRGGATLDMHADVLYLTNHYSQLPYVADHFGVGSAISHSAVIMPVEGPTVLVVDVPWWRDDLVVADDVRASSFVTEAVGQALWDTALHGKRLAFVGAGFMTASAYLGLLEVARDTTLLRWDDLVERLRVNTSLAEREIIRRAAEIGSEAMTAMMAAALEGNTEADAVGAALGVTVPAGAVFYDAASTSATAAHHYAWSRLPSYDANRRFEKGDIYHVDCYGVYGGYQWDFARARVIGDEPTDSQRAVMDAAVEGVTHVCGAIKPGMTGTDVFAEASRWLDESPQGRALSKEVSEFDKLGHVGHGIGLSWSVPWLMEGDETRLEPGMYVAVEMMYGKEGLGAAIYEENGLVTQDGFEVLTTTQRRWHT